MPSGSESHQLGPHVVGQRVVIRRVVPGELGPSGGPALTDVLGICLAWDPCVVQPETGPPVTIPLSLIVSGKPVPPRPSPRLRVSVREAEGHVASLFPGLETEPLGDWLLRNDPAPVGRPRKRANSCLAVGDPGRPVEEALAAVLAFYRERGRDAMAQVEADSPVEASLLDAGWRRLGFGEADFQLASLARARRQLGAPDDEAELTVSGNQALAVIEGRAAGRASLDGDWLGLHDLEVNPAHRRLGLARVVLDGLLEWGAEEGATTVWLHVETDNEAGQALYESLGFATHHTCRYLTP